MKKTPKQPDYSKIPVSNVIHLFNANRAYFLELARMLEESPNGSITSKTCNGEIVVFHASR